MKCVLPVIHLNTPRAARNIDSSSISEPSQSRGICWENEWLDTAVGIAACMASRGGIDQETYRYSAMRLAPGVAGMTNGPCMARDDVMALESTQKSVGPGYGLHTYTPSHINAK